MEKVYHILLIEDDESDAELIEIELDKLDKEIELEIIVNEKQLETCLANDPPDLIISDYNLPSFTGVKALQIVRQEHPHLPFILVSGYIGEEKAVDAMLEGASDYAMKENLGRLGPAIIREIESYEEYQQQQKELTATKNQYENLIHSVNGIVWEADAETFEFDYVSPQSEELLGYSPEEWLEQSDFWQDHIHPDDRREAINFCHYKTKQGEDHSFEYRMIDADDEIIWLRDYVTVIFKDGKPDRLRGVMVDITKGKKAEQQRDKAYEIAEVGHWELDPVNDELYWSDTVKKLHEVDLDFEPDLETSIQFYKEGKHRQTIREAVEDAINTGEPFEVELKIITAENNERWVRAVGETEFRDGKCVRLYGSTQNITQRKETERKLRDVVEYSTNMFYRHDTDHVLSYVSPQSEEFLGCSPEEAKRRWTEFITDHPINEEGFKKTQQAIDTGEAQPSFPLQLKKATGEEIWVRVNEAPITENGETVGIVGSLTDITEQKEYEAKIEKTNEKLTKAQEIAQLGYWEEDWETGEVYWSDQTYRIWGFDPEGTTITFEKIIERMHPEDVKLFKKENQRTHEEHVPLDLQHRIVLPDGSIKWLNVFATVKKTEDGTPLSLEGTVQDITETKELEQLLQRTNRLAKVGSWEIDFSENDEGDVYWSEMTREMLEVDEDYQPTVQESISFFEPEDQERAREIFEEAVANGTSYDMEMKVQTAKGNERWIRNIGQPEFRDGECIRVYGSFQDIHERKTSELQLERRNEFIEKILNNLPIGISVHYIESGKNIWMNQKFSEIYGWPQEELPDVDTFFEKVFPDPEYRETISSQVIADMESGDPERMQWSDLEITTKEGEKRFVDAKNIPLPEQNQMISSVVDITESKKHEQKLQESLELYEYVTKATDDVVYDWDIEKDILQWDDSFRDKFVYDVESGEYTIDYWAENVHPDDLPEAKSSLHDTLKNTSESKWEKRYRFKKQDGTYAHVFERGFIIRDEEGQATRMIGSLQDITERIRYQEELEDLALVASKTTDIIIITDAKDRITWVNDAFEELTGYSYGEAIGKNPGTLLQGAETDRETAKHLGEAVREQKSVQDVILNYSKDGTKYWLDITIDPIFDDEGNCEGFIAIEKDVTKQIKRQRELQESVERYDIVSKATSDTIWDLNLETDINRYNSNIYDMFGYEKQEVKNPAQWWRDKIHPEDRDIVTTQMEQALEADFDRFQMEYRFQCADGSYKYIYDRAFIVHDEDGNPIRMIGAMQDVTQQREEQKWLQLFQSAIASTKESVAIIEAEPDESPGREILYVNEAFCSMTGYTQAEAKGETLTILNGPKTSQKERDKLSRAMKNWETEEAEFINYKKDGEEFWIKVSMTPVRGPNDSFSYWVCVGRDITERKQREKELQKSLKEKETLLLEIHHRVKNNLAVVSGMMQLQAFEEEDQQFKEKLFDGVVRIQTMSNIHELLYQSESFTDVAFHENLKKLTNQITDTFGTNVKVKTNFEFDEVHLNINQAIPCSLIVNEVITNLLKHAFGDQDEGEITISISENDGKIYLKVTDDGMGQPPDLQEQRTAQSLGLKLIETLAQQLEADYEYLPLDDGAQFRLAFEKAQIKGSGSAHLV